MHAPKQRNHLTAARRGVTLIELLIVMSIIILVTASTLSVVAPSLDERRVREAARQVNAFIQSARARAIETGRPHGIRILPFSGSNLGSRKQALIIEFAEVPLPYGGASTNSTVDVSGSTLSYSLGDQNGWENLVQSGDLVQFNYQGKLYALGSNDTTDNGAYGGTWSISPSLPAGLTLTNVAFSVQRQPRAGAGRPLQLPNAVAIDMVCSFCELGTLFDDRNTSLINNDVPVTILFSPRGSVLGVSGITTTQLQRFNGPIFLLVGKTEGIDISQDSGFTGNTDTNVNDFDSIWVAIQNQTGLVTSVENAGGNSDGTIDGDDLLPATAFARQGLTLGGR